MFFFTDILFVRTFIEKGWFVMGRILKYSDGEQIIKRGST
jgi:hypothetical protein